MTHVVAAAMLASLCLGAQLYDAGSTTCESGGVQCLQENDDAALLQRWWGWGGPAKRWTYVDEKNLCPDSVANIQFKLATKAIDAYFQNGRIGALITLMGLYSFDAPRLSRKAVDEFAVFMYTVSQGRFVGIGAEHSDLMVEPKLSGTVQKMAILGMNVSVVDIDGYGHGTKDLLGFQALANGWDLLPPPVLNHLAQGHMDRLNRPLDTAELCLAFNVAQMFPWTENMENVSSHWQAVFKESRVLSRKEWLMSLWDPYKLADGITPAWPDLEVNWGAMFRSGDIWQDGLERAIVFSSIGAHRVELPRNVVVGGEELRYVVAFNDFAKLLVRPGFGRYGTDLYFTSDGVPAMLVTTDGRTVLRGDKDWQYWKFVWRSSLMSIVTLQDHLHTAHYRFANMLAGASRETLPPKHPLRRLLTVFTYGSIVINYKSAAALVDPNGVLSRATAFANFEEMHRTLIKLQPTAKERTALFFNRTAMDQLPDLLQSAPYYKDGSLLFDALRRLADSYVKIYDRAWCDGQDAIVDHDILLFSRTVITSMNELEYSGTEVRRQLPKTCSEMKRVLVICMWMVTGFHRHVGQVGDFAIDPDLASTAWKDGESFPRPQHAFLISTVAASTSAPRPKLVENFDHVFRGMERQDEAISLLAEFKRQLDDISVEISKRNQDRPAKNWRADPRLVETSVAI